MEKELFDWEEWDQADGPTGTADVFYKVKLKVRVGGYSPGSTFDQAVVDTIHGVLTLYDGFQEAGKWRLHLQLGEAL
jgi:hypothetical protein